MSRIGSPSNWQALRSGSRLYGVEVPPRDLLCSAQPKR